MAVIGSRRSPPSGIGVQRVELIITTESDAAERDRQQMVGP
jgi:hypothetical protein